MVFSFFWACRTELVQRVALRLPPWAGGWALPCLDTRVLALRGVLSLLNEPDYPDCILMLCWLGPFRRTLVP